LKEEEYMARRARVVVVDYPHHIVQRGNNRQQVFRDHKDYRKYLQLLEKYAEKYLVKILAYCLLGNHVHLMAVPSSISGLCDMMRAVAGCYCTHFNNKYARRGHLWESRFRSSIVDSQAYRWTVALYIEWNPVRSKVVVRPEEWEYSSARHHSGAQADALITAPLFSAPDDAEYRRLLAMGPPASCVEEIRKCTSGNRPIGSGDFLTRMAAAFGVTPYRRVGRPRKPASK
jgi:putative transposase